MDAFLLPTLWMLGGLVFLVVGGELLVRGASGLAAAARISPLVIGLTVVAMGTSSPELAVSLKSAFGGQADIAVGNVVGSNVFNVLFVLGLSALIAPLVVASQLVRLDVPLMIGVSLLFYAFAWDGAVERWEGLVLFAIVVVYTAWSVVQSRREEAAVQQEYAREFGKPEAKGAGHLAFLAGLIVVGLVLLGLGANWLVDGASTIARRLGTSDLLIGLTIVAVGTSLPEVAASVVASIRGERDIAVGNVVGSNLFNILVVLGLTGAIAPEGVAVSETALRLDIPVMIAVSVACLPVFFTGHRIARAEGVLFLVYYVAYTAFLVLAAIDARITPTYGVVLLGFVLPLTVVGLGFSVWDSIRGSDGKDGTSRP